jgi:tetratricopeptide (TPR) repeat protein
LPFLRNHNFVGREDKIDELEDRLFVKQVCQKVALVGLGGVGKTQVALQFAYTVLKKYPDVSVFWIHAQSSETLEQAWRDIANVLKIPGSEDSTKDVRELVKRELSAEKAGRWMLIVDNADDLKILKGPDGKNGILSYLPQSESGLTLFTTRDMETAQALACNSIMDMEKLDSETASNLFRKVLRENISYEEAVVDELLDELDYLPLAITQAAAYININIKLISIRDYLGYLQGTDADLLDIMSEEMSDHTRPENAVNAVARTWLVSFDRILQRDSHAADLLRYISCIAWKAIPRSILPVIKPEARMMRAIGTLCSYSFITIREDKRTYDMHRLVHVAARVWVDQKKMMEETQNRALDHLANIFPTSEHKDRDIWREYIPHAARLRDFKSSENANTRGRLYRRVGRCLQVDGRIRDAVGWLEESLDLRKGLSEDHLDRLSSQYSLAMVYQADGQVQEALQLLEHVVAIGVRVLAEEHPDRLSSQLELARAYHANGQVQKAIKLLEHVVAIEARVLEDDHPDRLNSQQSLARAYRANGQVQKATRLLEHVVAIEARVLEEDHPDRLISQQSLARAYRAGGQVQKAIKLLEHVVAIEARVVEEDHPRRLNSQQELAGTYRVDGQVQKAVQLLEHVVAIRKQVLAEDHPYLLGSQHQLAIAYQSNGQVNEAVRLLEHVVAIEEPMAEDHPDRLTSQHELATAYKANGQAHKAVQLLEYVVAIRKRMLPEDDPRRLASQRSLAIAYRQVNEARLLER